jgi:L-threonylcarbamoyladenylate synthase
LSRAAGSAPGGKTELLLAEASKTIRRALEVLQAGGLVAFPTDTVYGVGCLAFNAAAAECLYAAKDRPAAKAIPVLLGSVDDLARVALEVTPAAARLAAHFWPGPLTLVLPKHPDIPEAVSAGGTVGVRLPDHAFARCLLQLAGPLAVSSANRSGQPSPTTAAEVLEQLGGRVALVIDGGRTPGGVPSSVVDCVGVDVQVLRVGPISPQQILAVLGQ